MSISNEIAQLRKQVDDIVEGAGDFPNFSAFRQLITNLKAFNLFYDAVRLLKKAVTEKIYDSEKEELRLHQQFALCTYKDRDVPTSIRLTRAIEILTEIDDPDKSSDSETLGIAGAIYKRMWENDLRKSNLEQSLMYYLKGFENYKSQKGDGDDGYTGINAAFVSDLLGQQSLPGQFQEAKNQLDNFYFKQSKEIRDYLIERLSEKLEKKKYEENDWWAVATLTEAYFGNKEFKKAEECLSQAGQLDSLAFWKKESTLRQLISLAIFQNEMEPEQEDLENWKSWSVLSKLENNKTALKTYLLGKVGLALSGGGFRASIYHIGVLAKLAEADQLKHVEVISCVSGGSIIGTYYYLKLKKLLEEKQDSDIDRDDYVRLIDEIRTDFIEGVQKNIRMRILLNPLKNFRMFFSKSYSRTNRVGELYESILFSKIKGIGKKEFFLEDLKIAPLTGNGKDKNFQPKYENGTRVNKVPILILNATTLNTGHNWQFTATWMGEPPEYIDEHIDKNDRLRRFYFDDPSVPDDYKKFRLGYAVGASSCVPGLFEPLPLPDLYPDKIVRLADGGVHDNQGVVGLLEQDCKRLLVSDASGQMGTEDDPSSGVLGVPMRANDIMMERIRIEQFRHLNNLLAAKLIKGLMFIHLKMELQTNSVEWITKKKPKARLVSPTSYQIHPEIQEKIAAIRTDLDSFNNSESDALMASGYAMADVKMFQALKGFNINNNKNTWSFNRILPNLTPAHKMMPNLLDVSKSKFFKVWKLWSPLKAISWALAFGLIIRFGFWVFTGDAIKIEGWSIDPIATGIAAAIFLVGVFVSKQLARFLNMEKLMRKIALGIAVGLLGSLLSFIHIRIFDKKYIKY